MVIPFKEKEKKVSKPSKPRYCMAGCDGELTQVYTDEFVCKHCGMRIIYSREGNTDRLDIIHPGRIWGAVDM